MDRIETVKVSPVYKEIILEDGDFTYVGKAHTGCPENSPHWQIKRIQTLPGKTVIMWAEGDGEFKNKFSEYSTINYR
jgi:hypothetical protein